MDSIRLSHVGILVSNREKFRRVCEDLGLKSCFDEHIAEEGVDVSAFSQEMKGIPQIEIIQPSGQDSPLNEILKKRGEGLHHLCFSVKNLKKKCEELKSKGYHLLKESPSPGAKNTLVNFIHPKSTGGVLIELSEDL